MPPDVPQEHILHQRQRAEALMECGRDREAAALLSQLLLTVPDDAPLLCQLASAHFKLQEYPQTLHYVDRALSVNPDYEYAYRLRCSAQLRQGQKEALIAAQTAVAISPSSPQAMLMLCEAQIQFADDSEACLTGARLVALAPHWSCAQYTMARALFQSGQMEEALSYSENAFSLDPQDASAHRLQGLILLRLGRGREAANFFFSSFQLNRTDIRCLAEIHDALQHYLCAEIVPDQHRRGKMPSYLPLFLGMGSLLPTLLSIVIVEKISPQALEKYIFYPVSLTGGLVICGFLYYVAVERSYWNRLPSHLRAAARLHRYRRFKSLFPGWYLRMARNLAAKSD